RPGCRPRSPRRPLAFAPSDHLAYRPKQYLLERLLRVAGELIADALPPLPLQPAEVELGRRGPAHGVRCEHGSALLRSSGAARWCSPRRGIPGRPAGLTRRGAAGASWVAIQATATTATLVPTYPRIPPQRR